MVIPQFEGKQTLKFSEFSYFNTSKKKYIPYKINDLTLKIDKNDKVSNNFASNSSNPIAIRNKQDISYIKSDIKILKNMDTRLFDRKILILILSSIVIFILSLAIKLLILHKYSDPVKLKSDRAFKMALKGLNNWKKANESYSEIRNIILNFINNRLGISAQSMLLVEVYEKLKEINLSDELIKELNNFIENLDLMAFGNVDNSNENKDKIMKNTISILKKIDTEAK